jgi:hypothetical protein
VFWKLNKKRGDTAAKSDGHKSGSIFEQQWKARIHNASSWGFQMAESERKGQLAHCLGKAAIAGKTHDEWCAVFDGDQCDCEHEDSIDRDGKQAA